MEDLMPFDLPKEKSSIIKVIGVGGGGSNAVNYMYEQGITDVDFMICNTDQQALANSSVPIKLHLGQTLTEGLGAGNKPEKGREAAIENLEDVEKVLKNNTKMVFITAGMGGGTGTGAAPVIAKAAKDLGILTVGIVTIPFRFEGKKRIDQAIQGVKEINKHVDSLLVINNELLREMYGDLGVKEAFSKADNVLTVAAKGIAEIITKKGHVNVDFADVRTVMKDSGVAILGAGQSDGENRAQFAIEGALNSQLLSNNDITGAKNILLNITIGENDVTMDEIYKMTGFVQDAAGNNANLIWGYNQDISMGNKLNVTLIATGFNTDIIPELYVQNKLTNSREIENLNNQTKYVDDEIDFEVINTADDFKVSKPVNQYDNFSNQNLNESFGKVPEQKDEIAVENLSYGKLNEEENEKIKCALEKLADERKNDDQKIASKKIKKDEKSIDELETIPAYKRRNMSIDQEIIESEAEISDYFISDSDDDVTLSQNPYLHDNVD